MSSSSVDPTTASDSERAGAGGAGRRTGNRGRRAVLFGGFVVAVTALYVGLAAGTDLSSDEQRWIFSGVLLAFALVVAYVRHRRTGRWTPTDEEQLENARDLGSNRQVYISLGIGVVAAIVGVVVTGSWWVAPFVLLLFGFNALVDHASWRWFAKRKARKA